MSIGKESTHAIKRLSDPQGTEICFLGPDISAGAMPALIYFALSGDESLLLSPYNNVTSHLPQDHLRIFSFTIPGHGGHFDKHKAMQYWAQKIESGEYILEDFFESVTKAIDWLIKTLWIDPSHLALAGLSRGGFVATHVAAREKRVTTLLAFAPLTDLSVLEEFATASQNARFKMRLEELSLLRLVEQLTHLQNIRFYIGNRDMRVSTDACYHFIRRLADKAHEKRARHCKIDLFLTPSIGHKGHGTSPATSEEGAKWLHSHLIP